jgi:hypothetical protein
MGPPWVQAGVLRELFVAQAEQHGCGEHGVNGTCQVGQLHP